MLKRCFSGSKVTRNRSSYYKVTLVIAFFSLFLWSFSVSNPAFAGTGKAYIVMGDVEPAWYSTMLRSIFGQVDIRRDLDPVIQDKARKMKDMGYDVEIIDIGITSDIERIMKDPDTKAMAWFGHGDPNVAGTIAAYDGDITPGDIKLWAQERLAEKIGWPESWKSLSNEERRKNYELWNNAHFDLEYAYFHACYSLANNDMPDVLMADNGKFYGYPEKAYLDDSSTLATKVRGKDISETPVTGDAGQSTDAGMSGGAGSGTFPGEPFNGMQINYSVSGASIIDQSESYGFTTSRSLSGDLGSGQLTISGTASMQGGYGASLIISVGVDNEVEKFDAYLKTDYPNVTKQPFNIAVPIPQGAQSGSFSISMTGYYNAGERGLNVSGSFTGSADSVDDYWQNDDWDYSSEEYGYDDYSSEEYGYDDYSQNNEVGVYMDGWPLSFDVPPVIEDGRTLVPIRKIVESMGGTVNWYEDGTIDIEKDGTYITLFIDYQTALVDGEPVYLDVPPRVVDGRTLVPLRFVAETFGLSVDWDESTYSVYLNNY